ncbi:hypothetical protein [Alloacidobacterium sp.]|uniref:hypothetical protein n=1 Tax=Alloacidobacterium sp. TaxID=2951999 RepID=UPI002D2F62FD|nr:hypothetical protein [Alloacidobacterium sp.]HYK36824.1 hypothetical protein [Alloacidobacterium sp.]
MDMESSSASYEKDALEQGDGAGDPSYLRQDVAVWSSGDEESETTLAIFPFRLAQGLDGILIDQRYGFEHVKRRHVLLGAKNNKLIELWKGTEGAGPTYSTTAAVNIAGGREALLFYNFFSNPVNDAPDKLRIQALAYDAATGTMAPYSTEFSVLAIGPFRTIADARKQYAAKNSCSPWLWVLPAKEFEKPAGSGYVLATVASTSEIAKSIKAEARKCGFTAEISLFSMKRDSIDLW